MGPTEAAVAGEATYEVRIAGAVPLDVLRGLGEITLTAQELRTVMVCRLSDQAALHGFLARLRGLGLELVEVRAVGSPPSAASGTGRP